MEYSKNSATSFAEPMGSYEHGYLGESDGAVGFTLEGQLVDLVRFVGG